MSGGVEAEDAAAPRLSAPILPPRTYETTDEHAGHLPGPVLAGRGRIT